MYVEADREVCIGAGNCVLAAETMFDQDDDAVVEVLKSRPEDDTEESRARAAVSQCPSGALSVVEE